MFLGNLILLAVPFLIPPASNQLSDDSPFLAASPESQGISPETIRGLSQAVRDYVDGEYALGAEILVIKNRKTVLHEAYGFRDRDEETPLQIGSIFNIRSMTKTLTGAALQILIDEGAVSLDDAVSKYLPAFDNDKSRKITVRQLMTHRSGLPLTIMTSRLDLYHDLQEQAAAVGERGPEFSPDRKFWYSDAGTDVLGALVEVLSGVDLETFVTERLLDPLEMSDSFYLTKTSERRDLDRVVSLYVGSRGSWVSFWKPTDPPFYPFAWGSQSLFSTTIDYARFLAMWMDRGWVDGEPILSEEAVARTLAPVSKMTNLGNDLPFPTGFRGTTVYYGQMSVLHVAREDVASSPIAIGHSGSDGTIAWAFPALDLMILYFTQSRGGMSSIRLEDVIDELVLHPGEDDEIPQELLPYVGPYHVGFSTFRILWRSGHLAIDIPSALVFELEAEDDKGRWNAPGAGLAVSFVRDEEGRVTKLCLHQAGKATELQPGEAPKERSIDESLVLDILGNYESGTNRPHRVFLQSRRLAVHFADQNAPLDLYPPDEKGWWVLRIDPSGRVRFDRDEDGKVVSMTIHTNRGDTVQRRTED